MIGLVSGFFGQQPSKGMRSLPSFPPVDPHLHPIQAPLTYLQVLTINQPPYLHNLISVQRPRSTRSSSVVTLVRPPSSSSLKITDRSFRYASPCLWNRLPRSGTSSSITYSPIHLFLHSSLLVLLFHHSAHP